MTHRTTMNIVRGLLAGASLLGLGSVAPAASFDGAWSVLIVTETGDCDAAYRYGLRVENGTVRYLGDGSVDLTGHVDGTGAVQVSIARGAQRAEGVGHLGATAGSGTWTGASSTSNCKGRWTAERR